MLQFVLTTGVLFGPGLRFYRAGIPALLKGAPDGWPSASKSALE